MTKRLGYCFVAGIVWVLFMADSGFGQTTAPAEDVKSKLLPTLAMLEHGEYKQALPTLQALQQTCSRLPGKPDECRILVAHAFGYALKMNKDEKRAQTYLDQAIGMAVSSRVYSRALAINATKMDIAGDHRTEYQRDAAYLLAVLDVTPKDEYLIDLLGILLDRGASGKPVIAMADVRDRYGELTAELEKQRPGLRRWGVVWVSSTDYDILDHDLADALAVLRDIDHRLNDVDARQRQYNADAKAADRAYAQARREKLSSNVTGADPGQAQGRMSSAQSDARSAQRSIEELRRDREGLLKERDQAVAKTLWPRWTDESLMALPVADAGQKQPPPPMQKQPLALVTRKGDPVTWATVSGGAPVPEGMSTSATPATPSVFTEGNSKSSGSGFFVTKDGYLTGPPELVVEVASSSASIDLRDKRRAYCRNGVREYLVWCVADRRLEWFCLEEDEYRAQSPDAQGVLHSRVFPGLRLPVEALLAGDSSKVLAALAETQS